MKNAALTFTAVLLACGGPASDAPVAGKDAVSSPPDSLVLTSATGREVWFTLARRATGADGTECIERGLEIRHGGNRLKVPLLYTAAAPALVNDSTMRAVLWTNCTPGDPYLVHLRTGQPVRERRSRS